MSVGPLARAAYLLRFDALRRYFEVVVARIGVVAVLDGASVEQLAHLLLRLEYDVNVAFRLGRLILFARPFNSAKRKRIRTQATNEYALILANASTKSKRIANAAYSLDRAEWLEDLYQRLLADVPRNAAQEHLRRIVDHFVDARLQEAAPGARGVVQGGRRPMETGRPVQVDVAGAVVHAVVVVVVVATVHRHILPVLHRIGGALLLQHLIQAQHRPLHRHNRPVRRVIVGHIVLLLVVLRLVVLLVLLKVLQRVQRLQVVQRELVQVVLQLDWLVSVASEKILAQERDNK